MKLILFLAATYSLILHQSRKNALETMIPREQKIMNQKIITGNIPLSVKLYQQQVALRSDSIERLSFVSGIDAKTHDKRNEKDQQ